MSYWRDRSLLRPNRLLGTPLEPEPQYIPPRMTCHCPGRALPGPTVPHYNCPVHGLVIQEHPCA